MSRDATQNLKMVITADDKATEKLKKISSGFGDIANKTKGMSAGLTSAGGAIATGIGAGIVAIGALGNSILNTAGKFEKFQSMLTNAFNGSVREAAASMAMLKDFSAKTPYELDGLTNSFVKLVNRGFKPTRDEMTSLGDLSSSLGKDFDQLVEALLDAQTGEFERLKEFGVGAQASGDKVIFTFKGVTTTVDKSDASIRNYILSLGKLQGVQGSMITQSNTYEGKVSNLKDAWTNLSATLGKEFLPTAKKTLDATTAFLQALEKNVKVVADWGESTNSNVVFIADSFEWLKARTKSLFLSMTDGGVTADAGFSSYMKNIVNNIAKVDPQVRGFIVLIQKLQSTWGNAKTAMGSETKAIGNALAQSDAMGVSPDLFAQRIKQGLESGKLGLAPPEPPPGPGAGGGSKKSDKDTESEKAKAKQIEQEKELIKVTTERVNQVNNSAISEARKATLIVGINEDMQNELKKIRGDDQQDQENYFDKLAETSQDRLSKVKDSFKGMYDAVKTAIGKSKDEVESLTAKIKDGMDKIDGIKKSILDLKESTQTSLTDRFVDITNQLAEMAKTSVNFDSIEKYTEYQQKQLDLQKELNIIKDNVKGDVLDSALAFDKLTPAEKILAKAAEEQGYLDVKLKAAEAEVAADEARKKDELKRQENFNIARNKIESNYTQLFKDQLQDKTNAYAKFIADITALANTSKSGVNNIVKAEVSGITGQRALGGTMLANRRYLVGENGPEIVSPSSTSNVNPNLGGQTIVNINMGGVTVTNQADEDRLVEKVKKAFINEAKLSKNKIY